MFQLVEIFMLQSVEMFRFQSIEMFRFQSVEMVNGIPYGRSGYRGSAILFSIEVNH